MRCDDVKLRVVFFSSFSLQLGVFDGVPPTARVLNAEQTQTGTGQTRPQPPTIAFGLKHRSAHNKNDERDAPEHSEERDGTDAIDIERLDVWCLLRGLRSLAHGIRLDRLAPPVLTRWHLSPGNWADPIRNAQTIVQQRHLWHALGRQVSPRQPPPFLGVCRMTSTVSPVSRLDQFFRVSERKSSVAREVRGGLATFFTMAYIIVLNPLIIGTVADVNGDFLGGGSEPNLELVAAATALIAGLVTIAMGVFANYPLALATGLGLNAFVAFGIASQMSWADAMGLVVIEGLVILALVVTGFRQAVFSAVPRHLKTAISVGIGLFIALVGLVNSGFVKTTGNPSPPIGMGDGGSLTTWPVAVFALGLIVVIVLYTRRVKGAILWTILGTAVVAVIVETVLDLGTANDNPKGWNLNAPAFPDQVADVPDFSLLGQFSLLGSWESVGVVTVLLFIFTLMIADFFDTMGTMVAVGAEGNLLDEKGNPPKTKQILIVDSLAAAAGGAGSVSSNTSYIESASGVGEGARTGLASVVTGVCFLLATFLAPLVGMVPNEAAAPALVLVGFLMMTQVKNIPWDDLEIAIPAFLTMALMPFTYSISVGIGAGFISYVVLKLARGKARDVHPLLWVVAALFVVYFAIAPIEQLLGI